MTIETKKARFTKEELATEFEIGNLEERFNNAKKLVRYRLNSKGTKCWSVYGVYDNRQVKVNGIIKSTAKTGWHNAPAKVANDMLAQQCGITLVDFVNIEEFMNNREQATDKDPAETEQANANNRKFNVVIHYTTEREGVTFNGMDSTKAASSTEAAQSIITLAKDHPEYSITEFTIRDCKAYKTYRSNDADLAALKPVTIAEPMTKEEIERRMSEIVTERAEIIDELEQIEAETGDEDELTPQSHIDFLNEQKEALLDEYNALGARLAQLKANDPDKPAFEDGKVYILHATDRVGRPTQQLYKVKRVKMFGKNFLAIVEYIKRLNKFSDNVERYQIRTSSEGEYVEGVYVYSDNLYHSLYAKDLTDDPTTDKPADTQTDKPADDFMDKLAELDAQVALAKAEEQKASAAVDDAQKALDAAKDAHNAAIDKSNTAIVAFKTFGCQKAKELRDTLLENDIKLFSDAKIIIINQKGEEIARPDLSQIFITFYSGVFQVSASWDNFATYSTPAEVTDVIARLKAAITRGDNQFSFAHEDKPIEPVKFQVGATYAGKLPAKIAKKTITVTKISKAFVCFTMKYEKHLLTWRLKLRTDGKTEFVKDECGIFVRASDLVKELIA